MFSVRARHEATTTSTERLRRLSLRFRISSLFDDPLVERSLLDDPIARYATVGSLAERLAVVNDVAEADVYDVAVIGAGPSGLAASVRASSEGLRVLVVEAAAACGNGQGEAVIANNPGSPQTPAIPSAAIAAKYVEVAVPSWLPAHRAVGVRCDYPIHHVELDEGRVISARTVVLAMGVSIP